MEPNHNFAWYELAAILWREFHRADEALPIIEKLSETEGEYQGMALVLHGEILAGKDPEAALKCFDKAIELEPDGYPYHHLARLRFYLGRDRLDQAAEAIPVIAKALHKGGYAPDSEFHELQAILAMKQGRPAEAVKKLNVAIRFGPSEEKYYRLRSDAYEALGNLDKANADRRKAQEMKR